MRLELIRVGLLVELANHYTTKGAYKLEASVWNQMPWRNLQIRVLLRVFFFARTPSMIRLIVKICDVMDRFL